MKSPTRLEGMEIHAKSYGCSVGLSSPTRLEGMEMFWWRRFWWRGRVSDPP